VEEGEGGGAGVQVGVAVLRKSVAVAVLIVPGVIVAGAWVFSGWDTVARGVTAAATSVGVGGPGAVDVASTAGVAGVP
jgi:hypothetical protein